MRVALAPESRSRPASHGSEERGRAAGPSRAMAFARGAFARGARALIRVPLASTPARVAARPTHARGVFVRGGAGVGPRRSVRVGGSIRARPPPPPPPPPSRFRSPRARRRARGSSSAPSSVGKLVIVESPAKATKVQTYLGPGYTVVASYGHVRDLVEKSGSVVPEEDFAMRCAEREGRRRSRTHLERETRGCDHPRHGPRPGGRGHLVAHRRAPEGARRRSEGERRTGRGASPRGRPSCRG